MIKIMRQLGTQLVNYIDQPLTVKASALPTPFKFKWKVSAFSYMYWRERWEGKVKNRSSNAFSRIKKFEDIDSKILPSNIETMANYWIND